MCGLYDEPADVALCVDCDRAHVDDGYVNLTEYPRPEGSNAQKKLLMELQSSENIIGDGTEEQEEGEEEDVD